LPLFFSGYVFDLGFFTFWAMIAVVWNSTAAFFIIGLPIYDARHGISQVARRKKTPAQS